MDFLPSVIQAKYDGGFRIQLTFNDNLEGTLDLQRWLEGPIFEPLKDRNYFQQFFVDGGTVVWPNGADIGTGNAVRSCETRAGATTRWNRRRRPPLSAAAQRGF